MKLLIVLVILSGFAISCEQKEEEKQQHELRKPEENRFTKVVLAENLDQPMQFEILKDGRVLFVEREGKVKVYDPVARHVRVIADIPVSTGYYSKTGEVLQPTGEDGMQGVVLDPKFDQNHWIYLYYSPKAGNSGSILARYEWQDSTLNIDSKKILLDVPNQRQSCCHLGGGMVFDADGNLYLSTGDNTPNAPGGFAPLDERPGKSRHDSQRSSGNTNDLRGAILRIHPEPDGTYSIPEGNLFSEGTSKVRPEIYTMGNRNPYRLSIDSQTGWLYWGEVGPNGTVDSVGRGPKSYDEFNQARKAGNYGWPYFLADNKSYWEYDYATGKSGEKFNPARPVNDSPNNTGLVELPPARPAFIWYPQTISSTFPIPGSGSNSALGGPIYHHADFDHPERPFPQYYEGKWFITDWSRGWIMVVTMDKDGKYKSMERFLPELTLLGPNDMDFGPEGDLYVLEYGRGPYIGNPEAKLVRIEYNDGNREPIVQASANKTAGSVPLTVQLSSAGTMDYDDDSLTYEWKVTSKTKSETPQIFTQVNPVVTLSEPGIYEAVLSISDLHSTQKSEIIRIVAGNEPPLVRFDFHGANKSFFFPGNTINYSVLVSDKEDGSITQQEISPSQVSVKIDYLFEGFDLTEIEQSLRDVDASEPIQSVLGRKLTNESDCNSCHTVNTKTIGPAFAEIAVKYKENKGAKNYLTEKIISGGSGVWGDVAMPPHPTISKNKINAIVEYILGLAERKTVKSLPVNGTYKTKVPEDKGDEGSFVFRALYTDQGNNGIPPLTSSDITVLRYPVISVADADILEGIILNYHIGSNVSITPEGSGSYLGFNNIDLTEIKQIEFEVSAISGISNASGGTIEIRVDSPLGKLIGQTPATMLTEDVFDKNDVWIKAGISSVSGFHNIYFVFTIGKSEETSSPMQISTIKFLKQ